MCNGYCEYKRVNFDVDWTLISSPCGIGCECPSPNVDATAFPPNSLVYVECQPIKPLGPEPSPHCLSCQNHCRWQSVYTAGTGYHWDLVISFCDPEEPCGDFYCICDPPNIHPKSGIMIGDPDIYISTRCYWSYSQLG